MKSFLHFLFSVIALSLFRCTFFGSEIEYRFETKSKELSEEISSDSTSKHSITIWTRELQTGKKEPIEINYIVSEKTPHVENLLGIEVKLFAKNEKGEYSELPGESELKLEYYNGATGIKSELKNNKEPFNKLIDWKDVNYSYEFNGVNYKKKDNYITFTGSHDFKTKDYPDTIKLLVILKWDDGEKRIEKILTKGNYESPKWNPKF